VKKVHKKEIIVDKCAGDKGIRKALNRNGEVINPQSLIDIKFFSFDFSFLPLFFAKHTYLKAPIINVSNCKLGSI